MKLNEQQREFINDFAAAWDQFGGQQLQGRILALLYVAEDPELGANDIVEALGVSRGSVSQTTRQLIQLRLIQRVSRPGERRDFYRAGANAWAEAARSERARLGPFLDLLQRGLNLHNTSPPERHRPITNAIAFLEDYDEALRSFLEQWSPPDDPENPWPSAQSKPTT